MQLINQIDLELGTTIGIKSKGEIIPYSTHINHIETPTKTDAGEDRFNSILERQVCFSLFFQRNKLHTLNKETRREDSARSNLRRGCNRWNTKRIWCWGRKTEETLCDRKTKQNRFGEEEIHKAITLVATNKTYTLEDHKEERVE